MGIEGQNFGAIVGDANSKSFQVTQHQRLRELIAIHYGWATPFSNYTYGMDLAKFCFATKLIEDSKIPIKASFIRLTLERNGIANSWDDFTQEFAFINTKKMDYPRYLQTFLKKKNTCTPSSYLAKLWLSELPIENKNLLYSGLKLVQHG